MTVQAPAADVLGIESLSAGYGRTTVLRDVTLAVRPGSVAALLGPNGAGKTTLLRVAAGLLRPAAGTIQLNGTDVTKRRASERSRGGLCLIPEGRGIFPNLTVRENLVLQVPRGRKDDALDDALEAFPVLKERLGQVAGTMSGGQQQMLALSRSYLASPAVVLLDEVSMGLAPKVIDDIFEALRRLAAKGVALLLVEQYVHRALAMADVVYLLNRGRVTFSGPPSKLDEAELMRGYLGASLSADQPSQNGAPAPGIDLGTSAITQDKRGKP
jgi:branched-chain amino acid transport system ATP-binding protein